MNCLIYILDLTLPKRCVISFGDLPRPAPVIGIIFNVTELNENPNLRLWGPTLRGPNAISSRLCISASPRPVSNIYHSQYHLPRRLL